MAVKIKGKHQCPRRGCEVVVIDALFACRKDWDALPAQVKLAVRVTSNRHLLDSTRRAAIDSARKAWGDL